VSSFLLLNGLCVQMATSIALDYEKSAIEGRRRKQKIAATDL
jgi:hypothetical protein